MIHAIKLFIHDSFFDAFSVLSKKTQKKTREFMKKFKQNPRSSAINYEKINTFADKSLRTVRIDQKYRAIVQAPKEGNSFHLLWVDNHDEAMNWAKNKVIEWNKTTQSFQMYDKPKEQIKVKEQLEPINIKEFLFSKYTNEQLQKIGVSEKLIPLVKSLTCLSELEKSEKNLPKDVFEYLFYLIEGIAYEEILEEIEAGKSSENEEQSLNAQKNVYILTEDDELETILSGDFEKWKLFLHPSQRTLANGNFKGATKVTGGAGTGKTVCALHRAKFLADKLNPFDKPILFTTYTKSLTNYLNTVSESLGLDDNFFQIQNFDKIIWNLAKDPKNTIINKNDGLIYSAQEIEIWREVIELNTSIYDEKFLQEEYNYVILANNVTELNEYYRTSRTGRAIRIGRKDKTKIWNLTEEFKRLKGNNHTKLELCQKLMTYYKNEEEKPFSHLICDELQDFSNLELSLMRTLVEEKSNDLFFVGDPFQNIYGRKINFSKSNINVRGRRSKKLKVNYRTTEEIKKKAIQLLENVSYDNFDGEEESKKGYVSLMHGENPEYHLFEKPEQEDVFIQERIEKLLIKTNLSLNEICLAGRTKKTVEGIKKLLRKNEISYQDLSSNKYTKEAVRVSTFHNLKGHEFKYLFVVGVSKESVPFKHPEYSTYSDFQQKEYIKQERSLYYVVFSRAIHSLLISGVGEKSEWF